jgi:hypothetical protein
MLPRSPTKKESNGKPRSQKRKPSITIRRLAFGRGAGLKGPLRKDASMKKAQAQASDISVVAAVEHSQAHSDDSSSSGDSEQEVQLEATPRGSSKRLRSLFKAKASAGREDNNRLGDDAQDGEQDQPPQNIENLDSKEPQDFMNENIAQSIPPHLRHQFAAATVASIRRLEGDSDRQMIGKVTETMRELLKKPPHSQPTQGPSVDKLLEPEEDEMEQQSQKNKIVAKAQKYIRNGQQKEAIRELAKENLRDIANPKTKNEIIELVTKLFPAASNERLPTIPDDAPRILVSPDEAFKQWLKKAVQKIKASGIDGISTQVLRALQSEEDAVALIAKMIERIINAEVRGEG